MSYWVDPEDEGGHIDWEAREWNIEEQITDEFIKSSLAWIMLLLLYKKGRNVSNLTAHDSREQNQVEPVILLHFLKQFVFLDKDEDAWDCYQWQEDYHEYA